MSERFVICNHGVIEASLVPHQLLDRPGSCPYGVYDTFLISQGKVLDWDLHWKRLIDSCHYLKIEPSPAAHAISREAVAEVLDVQGLENEKCRLRVEIFAEPHVLDSGDSIEYLGAVWPVLSNGNEPVTIAVSKVRRQYGDPRYNHKLLGRSYVEEEMDAAAARHCGDVIFLNNRGEVCEGSYSNVWLLDGNKLRTPPIHAPCLPGVIRSKVFKSAKQAGLHAVENDLTLDDLLTADIMFLTSSIRGIQPVSAIENVHVFPETPETLSHITLLANTLLRG